MENISHTMLGFVLAKAGLERKSRFATTALVLGSNLPDVDAVSLVKGTLSYIDCHRGATHSIAGGALLAAAFGAGLWAFDRAIVAPFERRRDRRRAAPASASGSDRPAPDRARLLPLVAVSLLALLAHLGFDFLNDYGIRLLIPFSERWIYGDIIFIVDPWFWMILGGSLYLVMKPGLLRGAFAWTGWALLSLPVLLEHSVPSPARILWVLGLAALAVMRWRGIGRVGEIKAGVIGGGEVNREAAGAGRGGGHAWRGESSVLVPRIAVALLAAYIGGALILHQLALRRAESRIAMTVPAGRVRRLAVLPQPADPVHWRVVWEDDGEIRTAVLPAIGRWGNLEPGPSYVLNLDSPAARAALETPIGRIAHRFCRYLFADLEPGPEGTTVVFRDARFSSRGRKEFSVFTVDVPRGSEEPGS